MLLFDGAASPDGSERRIQVDLRYVGQVCERTLHVSQGCVIPRVSRNVALKYEIHLCRGLIHFIHILFLEFSNFRLIYVNSKWQKKKREVTTYFILLEIKYDDFIGIRVCYLNLCNEQERESETNGISWP